MNKGYLAAFAAYIVWGLSPIYWKIVASVPALEIVCMRIAWGIPALLLIFLIRRDFSVFRTVVKAPLQYKAYLLSPFLLATNWVIWIWSVSNGYVVDASLGYFINPLLNVGLGVVFLHERLRRVQWIALLLVLGGVLYLAFNYGQFPWIALTLATTFALYGFIRKTAGLGALNGLMVEISVLFIPAVFVLLFLKKSGALTLPEVPFEMHAWLSFTGLITVIPLVVFAYGARKIPYSTLGFIQFIAPTMQFLLGIYLYNEAFNRDKFFGFSFIWLALILYSFENLYFLRRRRMTVV